VAPTRATVLLQGESGTGKELVAKVLHQLSPRSAQPMVSVHCAALAPTLLESELFGHEKGAFTGATERRIGRFELAQGGTLFLDEIGEIDSTLQVKLLRFLGERTFERVGSNKTLTADVRLIAATNRDLQEMVKAARSGRICIFGCAWWRFGCRRCGIASRMCRCWRMLSCEFAKENNKAVSAITPDAMEVLQTTEWPGNVRELRTAIEHGVVMSRGEKITPRDLPGPVRGTSPTSLGTTSPEQRAGKVEPTATLSVAEAEKNLIKRALKECQGSRTAAAKKLGMSRRTLYRKLEQYRIEEA
jgi:two-component system, NtrC family, response regulator AtoC